MTNIEEAYQFSLQVEEKLKNGLMEGKEGSIKEEGVVAGHLEAKMRTRRKMKMCVLPEIRGMRISTTSMIKSLEIREEEVEDMDKVQEEEAFMAPISIVMKKVIVPLNALFGKEGQIGKLRVKLRVAHVDEDE